MNTDRVQWIDLKGKKILILDFSDIKEVSVLKEVISEAEKVQNSQPDHSVLRLTKIGGVTLTEDAKRLIAEYSDSIKRYTKASAAVGFSGVKFIIAKAINPNKKFFKTEEEALNWLALQE